MHLLHLQQQISLAELANPVGRDFEDNRAEVRQVRNNVRCDID
jgi:predicted transcriptional regulator